MGSYAIKKSYTFENGVQLRSENGEIYTILQPLGRGGQGEVYKVQGADGVYALKWYHKDCLDRIDAAAFRKNLQKNVKQGVPTLSKGDVATQFIWPLQMIEPQAGSFGYLMDLFPAGYEPFKNVVMGLKKIPSTGQVIHLRWKSWFSVVTAGLNIVRAFEILHSLGLSYQDINDGGIAVNMTNGDVFICDCDNVSPDRTNLGIRGMMTFMAPEVVRGEKLPDRYTDEFSLAIILFRLFMHGHPLEGEATRDIRNDPSISDKQSEMQIYGTNPRYCLSSVNNTNPASLKYNSDVLKFGLLYPKELLDAFEQVFTLGIRENNKRLTATEWRKILLSVRDHLVLVNGYEAFFGKRYDKELPEGLRILKYKHGKEVYCMPDKILYSYHFNEFSNDFKTPVGKIIPTARKDVLGLYNASPHTIRFSMEGKEGSCPPKGKMPIMKGMEVSIDRTQFTVI